MNRAFGNYHLRRRIAVGGMAELFLATVEGVEGFARPLAIKCMLPELARDPEFVKMFVDEAKLAAKLFHPDIVQVYELGVVKRRYFIAMEYVQGLDLAAFARRSKEAGMRLPEGAVLHIGAAALRALHYAHEKKDDAGIALDLVHRDVSPQNILLSEEGVVKLTDFGIARARTRATNTNAGTLKGKFAYMAPEYAQHGALDRKSDLFSLAMVLYELFAGEHPYQTDSEARCLELAQAAVIPELAQVVPGFPAALSAVLKKALAKDPADRFATAEQFGIALDQNRGAFAASSVSELGAMVTTLRALDGPREDDDFAEMGDATPPRKARLGHATGVVQTPAVAAAVSVPPRRRTWPLALAAVVVVAGGAVVWAFFRAPPPAPTPVATEVPRPASAPVAVTPSAPAAVIPAGYLTLNSSPWSEVWIDGKKVITSTPLHSVQLPIGRHQVRLFSPPVQQAQEFAVDISPGHTTTRIVNFEEKKY